MGPTEWHITLSQRFFPRGSPYCGMAKNGCGEYITLAVISRRFGTYFAPRGLGEEREKMTMRLLVTIALLSLVVALALPPMAAADAAADYKAKCAMCHGADGMGKAAMGTKDLGSADIQKMSDADLTGAITNGKGKMPAYKGKLTDAQISDLVKYIRTLKK
jgi:cytochrome c6